MPTINPYLGVQKLPGYKTTKDNRNNKENQRRYGINFHKKNDKELIKWLEDHKPYQKAFKTLISEQIAREKLETRAAKRASK